MKNSSSLKIIRNKLTWYIIALIIILLIILYRTSNKNFIFYEGIRLTGEVIISGDKLGYPKDLIYISNSIIVLDSKPIQDNIIKLFSTKDYKQKFSTGKNGSGPGEFIAPFSISEVIGKPNSFNINDISLWRVSEYCLDGDSLILKRMISMKGGMPLAPILMNDSIYISLAYNITAGRLAVYDSTGLIKKNVGEIPPGKELNTPIPIHLQAYKGELKITPDGKYIIISAQYSDLIEIYDKNFNLIKRVFGPLKTIPQYSVSRVGEYPVMTIDEKNAIWGYIDIDVSNELIFALFSGEQFSSHKLEGNLIHVYNMAGQLMKTYELNEGISSIAVDTINQIIYGLCLYPSINIIKFSYNQNDIKE